MKNIRNIGGKPMLCWCVDAAVKSELFSRVFVSTEDSEIARISTFAGYDVHNRDPTTASDSAPSESGIKDFLDEHPECDICCLLQATSPLTNASHLIGAYEQFKSRGADSLVTVVKMHRFLWKVDGEGIAVPVNY